VFSASLSLIGLLLPARKDKKIVFATIEVFFASHLQHCSTTKIYWALPHHANQMHALQVQQEAQNSEMANDARLTKSEVGTFYVYLMFLVCYLPNTCFYYAISNSEWSTNVKFFASHAATLVFLNSSLNSLIYCLKMRQIRHTVMDRLWKIVPSHDHNLCKKIECLIFL